MNKEQLMLFPLDNYVKPSDSLPEHSLGLSKDAEENLSRSLKRNVDDGTPYLPSHGAECGLFTSTWCNRCLKQPLDPTKGGCSIFLEAIIISNQPDEWLYCEGHACCTKFNRRKRTT
ncbi:hypothetical protein [cf. Phormidesmis sp. LEGE 11477]|uniref:hypothetical protein n=1 Tax=cf. Phormidesmis sp. LEGE 11477 TaxID=1828680 RepID=UPI00188283BC|nr:hypothetical protein [cf. Phormidesmis sp. LEGE 11477]MBE9062233.1 hypothetical protein [cf. Phormidesmis sp. LEGE 11477]